MGLSPRWEIVAIITRFNLYGHAGCFIIAQTLTNIPKKRQNPPPRRWFKIVKADANKAMHKGHKTRLGCYV